LKVKRTVLLLNRVRHGEGGGHAGKKGQKTGRDLFDDVFALPEDPGLNELNMEGRPVLGLPADSPAFLELSKILGGILK
jgi:hypothetical protein